MLRNLKYMKTYKDDTNFLSLSALYLLNVLYEDIVLKHLTFKFLDTIEKVEKCFLEETPWKNSGKHTRILFTSTKLLSPLALFNIFSKNSCSVL